MTVIKNPGSAFERTNTGHDAPLAEHLLPLPGGSWAIWKTAGLRGAGFPAALILELADPACVAAADHLVEAEDAVAQTQQQALDAVNGALDALRRDQQWGDTARREPLLKALRSLKKGQVPDSHLPTGIMPAIDAFLSARTRAAAAEGPFREAFAAAVDRCSQTIRQVAQTDSFREALTWQNRQAVHTGIEPLLRRQTEARDAEQRRSEQMIASYLQRYCAKNDTIGFFGPVGWAHFDLDEAALDVQPGLSLLASRSVGLEAWCVDTICQSLAKNTALRPWIAPRRLPFVHVEGTTLYLPLQAPATLPAGQAAILQACDSERTALAIAEEVLKNPANGMGGVEEVLATLAAFESKGLIAWTLEVPVKPNTISILRRQVERIGDAGLREGALAVVMEIESAQEGIAQAAGDARKLDAALERLETTFTQITGQNPTRSAGRTSAARTLAYEDSRRAIDVTIGRQVLEALGPSLSLLMKSARWFTYETARTYRQAFEQLYKTLVQQTGSRTVDGLVFWQQAQPLLMDSKTRPLEGILARFQERWQAALAFPEGQRRVTYTSEELSPRVSAAFDAPEAGWRMARYQSPDVLIDAPDIDAIRRGDYQFVLGELHIGANPLLAEFFREQHPSPQELWDNFMRDIPAPLLVPIPTKQWPGRSARVPLVAASAKDLFLVCFPDTCDVHASQAVTIGELVVEDLGDGLIVRTRDGRLQYDCIEAFAGIIAAVVITFFKLLRPQVHVPRITVDRLVIQRETWRFSPGEMPFANEKDEASRFLAARRWIRAHCIPRSTFISAPIEPKPFHVDFDSPISVDILAKTVRRMIEANQTDTPIAIAEMLPDHQATWLPDAGDQRYTSEFRFVAVNMDDLDG